MLTAEQAAGALQSRLSAKLPGLDPAKILANSQALIGLLTSCGLMAGGDVQAAARTIRGRLAVRRAIRDEGFGPFDPQLMRATDAAPEVAHTAEAEECEAFLQCCGEDW